MAESVGEGSVDLLLALARPGDYICVQEFISFFFQAEDGIRDWSVTGVQTCALPICEVFKTDRLPAQTFHDQGMGESAYGCRLVDIFVGVDTLQTHAVRPRHQRRLVEHGKDRGDARHLFADRKSVV